ncbi:hypothetical protein SDC9_80050 [bioreactor metagenome]|uniref:Uncharacterized protein n=1 Tax=bioreactor metagenome TaxID=1076179 RepID=A0A644Z5V1_9ZZZZ
MVNINRVQYIKSFFVVCGINIVSCSSKLCCIFILRIISKTLTENIFPGKSAVISVITSAVACRIASVRTVISITVWCFAFTDIFYLIICGIDFTHFSLCSCITGVYIGMKFLNQFSVCFLYFFITCCWRYPQHLVRIFCHLVSSLLHAFEFLFSFRLSLTEYRIQTPE